MGLDSNEIYYSSKYYDDDYEYRHVHALAKRIPEGHLMSEEEWRALGIQQSAGWEHYLIHGPERHVLLFRRRLSKSTEALTENQAPKAKGYQCKVYLLFWA